MATLTFRRMRRAEAREKWAGRAAVLAGTVIRLVRARRRTYPGIAGAVLVAVCLGGIIGHTIGHGLTPWVAGLVGGGFLLWFGSEINRAPQTPPPDTGSSY
jgi:uncharacterized protein YcfJ